MANQRYGNGNRPTPFDSVALLPFPTDSLPAPVALFVKSQSAALQVPEDLLGCIALGVAATAAAGRCSVRFDSEWSEPLNLFITVALPSGERRSPAFRAAIVPLQEREKELAQFASVEIAERSAERDVMESRLKLAKANAAKDRGDESAHREVIQLARELEGFEVPNTPRLWADDVSSEALASLLADHKQMAVMSTEGGQFDTMAGRYSEGVPNIDVYLKGYSGDPLRVDRKGRGPEVIESPALTLLLTPQPDVIRGLGKKPGFRKRGLLARFLYSLPIGKVGYRSTTASPVPAAVRESWKRVIKGVLKVPFPPDGEEHAIELSPQARSVFQEYRQDIETQLRPGEDLNDIVDWGNKLAGVVLRLAGILHLLGSFGDSGYVPRPWEIRVSRETMASAIALGKYFTTHAQAAFALMGVESTTEDAKRVWASIQRHFGKAQQFTQRDLWQKVRRRFPADELGNVLTALDELGYVRPAATEGAGRAGRPSRVFEINPLAKRTPNTQNLDNESNDGNFGDSGYANGKETNGEGDMEEGRI